MEYEIMPYTEADVDAMIEIWNEVVRDGAAFPQLDELNHKTGVEFFGKQDFVGVAKVNGEVAGLYILHPNNVGRCGHHANASYAVSSKMRGMKIGEGLVRHSLEKAKELGVKPMATWVAGELAGVEPRIMGIGPVAATRKVMKKAGYEIGDFDLIEANEAFAAQSVAVAHDLGFNNDILNVNGGAIALGHPVGASGCRILVTLLHEMEKRDAKKGLATLCVGGGMGCAAIVERE